MFFFGVNLNLKDANGVENEHEYESSDEENNVLNDSSNAVDLEDMGALLKKGSEIQEVEEGGGDNVKDMLTPLIRESLTKQGYKLIGW